MTKWVAEMDGHKAVAFQTNGDISLEIFKDGNLAFRNPTLLYSLRDASAIVRRQLNLKGTRIKWEAEA